MVIDQKITETLKTNYMPYAMSVIVSRALPEIDGFKPSHRKLLYTMYKMNLIKGQRTKSANIVGQTMKLNPHGDGAIYETMVRLTKGYGALNTPFVDSKGNFGKVYSRDMAYAASRYTEAKLSEICNEIFNDIEEDAVDFVDNYDGTLKEPVLLPTRFPNILVNPNQGIAVGMASNICSFNLKEVCDATIAYLKNEKADLMDYIIAPDFPTGGKLIYNKEELRQIFSTGKGSFKVRAKYDYVKKENCIEITEIPYTTTVEAIIDKLEDLIKNGKVREISDVRDETDLSGLKLTLDLKRNTNPDKLMDKLYKATPLEDSFSCNFNILVDGMPKVMGIREILQEWTKFRQDCIVRKYNFAIAKMEKKLHLLLGLKEILLDIDAAIEIVRNTEKEKDVVPRLMAHFKISEMQAEYVAEIKLRHLNREYILNTLKEVEDLEKEILRLKDIVGDPKKVKKVIIDELKQISKKYGTPRTTEIIAAGDIVVPDEEEMIEDYNVRLFFTDHQYLKKITLVSLRSSGEQKLKDEDKILQEYEINNKSELLMFTNQCNVYKIKLYEIEECKASQYGVYLPNLLHLNSGEQITYICSINEYKGYVLFAFENGKVAKVSIDKYQTKNNRRKLVKAFYDKTPCTGICKVDDDNAVVRIIRSDDKEVLVRVSLIEEKQKRDASGVTVVAPSKKYTIKGIVPIPAEAVTEKVEKRLSSELPISHREMKVHQD